MENPRKADRHGLKKGEWIGYGLLLAAGMIAFYSLYINKVFPTSEAWHITFVQLMRQGKIPYRDFYYYLPPMDLFVSNIMWTLSFGSYLAYRCWRLVERILIAFLVFRMLCRYTKPAYAWIAALTGGIMYASCVYDLCGDYNQTGFLFLTFFSMAAIRFADADWRKEPGQRKKAAFAVGITLGLLLLTQQAYFVATFLVFFFALVYVCWAEKNKDIGVYILFAAIGAIIPILIMAGWLFLNGALVPFFEQVFLNVDSKGSLVSMLIGGMIHMLLNRHLLVPVSLLFATCIAGYYHKKLEEKWNKRLVRIALCVGALATIIAFIGLRNVYRTTLWESIQGHRLTQIVFYLLLFFPAVAFWALGRTDVKNKFKINKEGKWQVLSLFLFLCASVLLLYWNPKNIAQGIYGDENYFASFNMILARLVCDAVALILFCCAIQYKLEPTKEKLQWLFLFAVAFAGAYARQMGSGTSLLASYFYILALPVLLVFLFKLSCNHQSVKNGILIAACFLMMTTVGAQKTVSSYQWWGADEEPIQEHTESIDIPGMEGFRVTGSTKELYEEITEVVRENSDEDSHVLGYPHMVIFNQLADRTQMDRFVPVFFYDVAARKYVEEDIQHIISNPPDIVIWEDIPYCYETHEATFNQSNERLSQYQFEVWFAAQKNTAYELVGQVENVFVYKLKDNGIPVFYRYINGDRVNETASILYRFRGDESIQDLQRTGGKGFKGEGTFDNPYQIGSADDLIRLSEKVNSGVLYENKYFIQTADIDMQDAMDWKPIGEYGLGTAFLGTYNGQGHVIRNLKGRDGDYAETNGLFGLLGGTVYNLGIEDSEFSGTQVGFFANYAYGTPKIVNCYVYNCTAETDNGRAGFIGNAGGAVITNCWSSCEIESPEAVGNLADGLNCSSCYSIGDKIFAKTNENDISVRSTMKNDSAFEYTCQYLNDWIEANRRIDLVQWQVKDHRICFK